MYNLTKITPNVKVENVKGPVSSLPKSEIPYGSYLGNDTYTILPSLCPSVVWSVWSPSVTESVALCEEFYQVQGSFLLFPLFLYKQVGTKQLVQCLTKQM